MLESIAQWLTDTELMLPCVKVSLALGLLAPVILLITAFMPKGK